MMIFLSYPLGTTSPTYLGAPSVEITPHRLIANGYRYNSYRVSLWNHAGTHVDSPRHVYEKGPGLSDLDVSHFFYTRPIVIDIPVTDDELIIPQQLEDSLGSQRDWDFIGIRTGFGQYRHLNPERYIRHNPGLSPQAANWLVTQFPRLRAIAVDLISVTSAAHAEAGWETHRILLHPENPRLIIEDVNLPLDLPPIRKITVAPIFIEGIDSSWCSVLAET
jgi:arylformamidase